MKAFSTSIVQTLRQRGFQAYLVGGCVRDLLLGREPKDYDVATDATPKQVMEIFPETYAVGVQFGVVLIPAPERGAGRRLCRGFFEIECGRSGDLPQRYRVFRREASGRSSIQQESAGGCRETRLHHQRNAAGSGERRGS